MQVADVRRRLRDDLAIHLQNQPQHPVRGRMRRPHVEDEFLPEDIPHFAALLRAGGGVGKFEFGSSESHGESAVRDRREAWFASRDAASGFCETFPVHRRPGRRLPQGARAPQSRAPRGQRNLGRKIEIPELSPL